MFFDTEHKLIPQETAADYSISKPHWKQNSDKWKHKHNK